MKCLFCASEAFPFMSSGGLADVAYSLPCALRSKAIDCRIVMPLYEGIPEEFKSKMKLSTYFYVPVSWRSQYCGLFEINYKGIIYYFIDNEYYFKRPEIYGHFDDAERFAFFSRAILEMLPKIDFKPDIIHANDWQTALVPVYQRLIYSHYEYYSKMKTVFTIHNIHYQGKFDKSVIKDIVGVEEKDSFIVHYDGCTNFMKGAVETADQIITVSPTYAKEILNSWFSYGLHHVLQKSEWKIVGILNGIDTSIYNPETDIDIYENYSVEDLPGKTINKKELRLRLNLDDGGEIPLIGMVTRLVEDKGLELVKEVLDKVMKTENIQFVVLGSGLKEYEHFFDYMQGKYKGRFSFCHGFVPELSHKIYAASDIFLMPSKFEPCGISQMIALKYGSIPIVRETGGLFDTIKDSGDQKGNGFTFKTYDSLDMMNAIKRAVAGYWQHKGWEILVKRAMMCDNSWKNSANKYIDIYKNLVDK
ncbi:MAG: Glycogen synthase [Eubacteriales bacterium SKADARSKE-1]|nr:Glycogen synthase [Eubacteriales bacterium SKADARSKE-1]